MNDMNKIIDRKNTNCHKWDMLNDIYGRDDLLSMWIADMDIATPEPIVKAINKRAKHQIYGYEFINEETYNAIIRWQKLKHNFTVKKDWISFTPGVVVAVCFAIQSLTEIGDEILLPTPVYQPFHNAITDNDRILIKCPLKDGLTFDFDDMESKITPKTSAIILSNPHNPNGRVWTFEELSMMNDFAKKHNLIVIDDEIHNDLIFKGKHTVFPNISEDALNRTIYIVSPSKTFNTAGLKTSVVITKNPLLKEKFDFMLTKNHMGESIFSNGLLTSAYSQCDDEYSEMIKYLRNNIDYMVNAINNIKNLEVKYPEGTYLLWVDFNKTGLSADEINSTLVNKCKLALNDGRSYGEDGYGFFRINIACPFDNIMDAAERLKIFNTL